jgi:methionyl-tRNA synthetase
MSNKKFIYITTAIDYANASPHVGHALEKLQADVLARWHRLQGKKVFFLTGTDEHGSKMAQTAETKGITPQQLADENSEIFKKLLQTFNISNDDFIRTSDIQRHYPTAQKVWKKIYAKGDLKKNEYEGLYCVGCENFLTEKDLVDGKCPDHDREPEKVKEINYFFNLGKYNQKVINLIENGELEIVPDSRRHEILNILKEGMKEVSFSRPRTKLSWGVPVPDDPDHVMYVWCDALTNYISALGYAEESDTYKSFWEQGYIVHVIGKDILRFHAALWPAMLLSIGLKLPNKIFTHGFVTSDGKKMSKSLGNVVDPIALVEKYGVDPVRYFFLKEIPATGDGDFSEIKFREVYMAELANGLGNLVSRTSNMIETYLQGKVVMQNQSDYNWQRINEYTELLQYNKALDEVKIIIDDLNKRIDDCKPWQLIKTGASKDQVKIQNLLNNLATTLRDLAYILLPYIPNTATKIKDIFIADTIHKSEPLFPRFND